MLWSLAIRDKGDKVMESLKDSEGPGAIPSIVKGLRVSYNLIRSHYYRFDFSYKQLLSAWQLRAQSYNSNLTRLRWYAETAGPMRNYLWSVCKFFVDMNVSYAFIIQPYENKAANY